MQENMTVLIPILIGLAVCLVVAVLFIYLRTSIRSKIKDMTIMLSDKKWEEFHINSPEFVRFYEGYVIQTNPGKAVIADMHKTAVIVGRGMQKTLNKLESTYGN